MYVKLLVTNAAAGSIIGKAGNSINDFQQRTFSRIQLSKAGDYFPGTAERTLLVTGRIKQIIGVLDLIFQKLLRENVAPLSPRSKPLSESGDPNAPLRIPTPRTNDSVNHITEKEKNNDDDDQTSKANGVVPMESPRQESIRLLLKLLIPIPICGIIIGKGGSTIKAISLDTSTVIRVTVPQEIPSVPPSHRIVTINGTVNGVLKAVAALVVRQSIDPKFHQYADLPLGAHSSTHGVQIPIAQYYPSASVPNVMPHSALPSSHTNLGMQFVHPTPYHSQFIPSNWSQVNPGVLTQPHGATGLYRIDADGSASISFQLTVEQQNALSFLTNTTSSVHKQKFRKSSHGLEDIEAASGVEISLEDSDHSLSGTAYGQSGGTRKLTIIGGPEGVNYAHYLLSQRLAPLMVPQTQGLPHYYYSAPQGLVLGGQNNVLPRVHEWAVSPLGSNFVGSSGTMYPSTQNYAVQAYMHQKYGRKEVGSNKPSPRTHTPRQVEEHS